MFKFDDKFFLKNVQINEMCFVPNTRVFLSVGVCKIYRQWCWLEAAGSLTYYRFFFFFWLKVRGEVYSYSIIHTTTSKGEFVFYKLSREVVDFKRKSRSQRFSYINV